MIINNPRIKNEYRWNQIAKERDPGLEKCYQLDSKENIQGSSMAYRSHMS
jgi:hypothetical protein